MRMRKKKWADPYLQEHDAYALTDPAELKGNWKRTFGGQKLHLEIGMGKGDYLEGMAAMYPENLWIGMEKDHSIAAIACRKALEKEEPNTRNKRMIVGDAEEMENWFAPGEIDVIHLNFSDPWPKKRTHKRRLSGERFLEIYRLLLSRDGEIRMKTDNKALFEDSVLYFLSGGFTFTEFSVDFRRNDHAEDAITEYERRFMELGQPIYQLCAVRKEKEV